MKIYNYYSLILRRAGFTIGPGRFNPRRFSNGNFENYDRNLCL